MLDRRLTWLVFCVATVVVGCAHQQTPNVPISCGAGPGVSLAVESARLWEVARLADRVPLAPRVEGVVFTLRPDAPRAAIERALRCGQGKLGEALQRAGTADVEVRDEGAAIVVRARTSSREGAESLVAEFAP